MNSWEKVRNHSISLNKWRNEIHIHKMLSDKILHIPRLISYTDDKLIMQRLSGPTLFEILTISNSRQIISKKHINGIVGILDEIGKSNILHNDLHSKNIIYHNDDDSFYIVDFGKSLYKPLYKPLSINKITNYDKLCLLVDVMKITTEIAKQFAFDFKNIANISEADYRVLIRSSPTDRKKYLNKILNKK